MPLEQQPQPPQQQPSAVASANHPSPNIPSSRPPSKSAMQQQQYVPASAVSAIPQSDVTVLVSNSVEVKPELAFAYPKPPSNSKETASSDHFNPSIDLSLHPDAWCILISLNPNLPNIYLKSLDAGYLRKAGEETLAQKKRKGVDPKDVYLFGRFRFCDVVSSNPLLSKKHCWIYKEEVKRPDGTIQTIVRIEDISTNGTYVNGHRLTKGSSAELKEGDEIQLAKYDPSKRTAQFDDRFWMVKFHRKKEQNLVGLEADYAIIHPLGTGSFSTVFMAKNRLTGRAVAVKMMDNKLLRSKPKFLENVQQEVQILMGIHHTCIINIEKIYQAENKISLILELARGGELFDRIVAKRVFTEREARTVMIQLLLALEHLHAKNIAHRDLKPENILLLSKLPNDLRIKISDFGLAKIVGEESFLKTLCGTPNYVAPEVLAPSGRSYGKEVDMWSTGVVFYILLCGYPPFSPDLAPPTMSDQIKQGRFFFQTPYWDTVSEEAKDLVRGLLTVDPVRRYTATDALEHVWTKKVEEVDMPADKEFRALFEGYRERVNKISKEDGLKRKGEVGGLVAAEINGGEWKKVKMG
ncbi:hypothetical protein HDV05_002920 [Chytridiales sp. JEL 0842]|nr:hypothetical protein HDV05_002920 [Chytridiales sp. JEL 0842]